jgi:hypothetical protein
MIPEGIPTARLWRSMTGGGRCDETADQHRQAPGQAAERHWLGERERAATGPLLDESEDRDAPATRGPRNVDVITRLDEDSLRRRLDNLLPRITRYLESSQFHHADMPEGGGHELNCGARRPR